MEIALDNTMDSTPSPTDLSQDIKGEAITSKWSMEESLPQVSESEQRTFRIAQFNEKFQEFLTQ